MVEPPRGFGAGTPRSPAHTRESPASAKHRPGRPPKPFPNRKHDHPRTPPGQLNHPRMKPIRAGSDTTHHTFTRTGHQRAETGLRPMEDGAFHSNTPHPYGLHIS